MGLFSRLQQLLTSRSSYIFYLDGFEKQLKVASQNSCNLSLSILPPPTSPYAVPTLPMLTSLPKEEPSNPSLPEHHFPPTSTHPPPCPIVTSHPPLPHCKLSAVIPLHHPDPPSGNLHPHRGTHHPSTPAPLSSAYRLPSPLNPSKG